MLTLVACGKKVKPVNVKPAKGKPATSKPAKIPFLTMKDMLLNGTSRHELRNMLKDGDGNVDPKEEVKYDKAVKAVGG